jgi:hypothetical protein
MNVTLPPQQENDPVLAILKKVRTKKSGKKFTPDAIELLYRVGTVQAFNTPEEPLVWKWRQIKNHAQFQGPVAYDSAKQFALMMKSGATIDEGAKCFADKGSMASDASPWRKIEAVEVVV